ncbi:MAG: hypothetical protein K0S90_1792, partial [Enterobacteriaceae bacterium]|nr:hypothetical protein [Enterobacteriaceae bacterium]
RGAANADRGVEFIRSGFYDGVPAGMQQGGE